MKRGCSIPKQPWSAYIIMGFGIPARSFQPRHRMQTGRIQELIKYYREHTDQEFVKRILQDLRTGELSDSDLDEIGDWIARRSRARNRNFESMKISDS
jgi:hypothetical protein